MSSTTLRCLRSAGIAVLLAYVLTIPLPAAFDTWQRGAKAGAITAEFSLIILWTLIALVVVARRWKETTMLLRLLLLVNGTITCLLVTEAVRHVMQRSAG
jgi:hypothetical protein